MKRTRRPLVSTLLVAALAACAPRHAVLVDGSAADRAANPPSDGTGRVDARPAPGQDSALDAALATAPDRAAPPSAACVSAADQALFDTQRERSQLVERAYACASRCHADADAERCSRDCFADATGLTPACAACHRDLYACTLERCSQQCVFDNWLPSCLRCTLEQRCFATFYACAGSLSAIDACRNAVDGPLLRTAAQRGAHHAIASACAMDCSWKPDLDQCAGTCIADNTGLSSGCRDCYAQLVICAGTRCANFCEQGLVTGWCAECMREHDCYPPFYVCSGLLPD